LKLIGALIVAAALGAGGIAAAVYMRDAADPVGAGDAVTQAEPRAQAQLVRDFSVFAGSDANARSLVLGLLRGTEIVLAPGSGQPGPATRFVPPTRPMDYGSVRIALVLAREQLDQLGIARPSPAHIKSVLAGGGVAKRAHGRVATPVLLPGVLQMRASGMPWQKIAGTMDVPLAQVMSGWERQAQSAGAPDPISSASITKSTAGGPRVAPAAKPVVTAARRPSGQEPVQETRRSSTRVAAAADVAAAVERVAPPPQELVRAEPPRAPAVIPAQADNLAGSEETQVVD
jgi:hypothetical protein